MRLQSHSISAVIRRRRIPVALATGILCLIVPVASAGQGRQPIQSSPFLRIDPESIVLSARDSRVPCGECHGSEYDVWRESKHATGFETMHRTESAHDILEKMGLTVTKRQESLCMRCHYTVGPKLNAIAGVSCESCHGPARDWINVHNSWGDGVDHPDRETPEHRQQRIAQSAERGMLRPSGNLYAVAANCFECHTVPIEELVNKGGHSTGSTNFDLVERAGQIRHNFVQEQWGGEKGNRAPSVERTRLTFATGRILAYEFALRGLANATAEGRYAKAMERRFQQSARDLDAVARAAPDPAITEILKLGSGLRLVPGNGAAILAAATRIRTLGQTYTSTANGTRLAGLDALLGGAPAEAPEPPAAAPGAGAPAGTAATPATTPAAPPPTGAAPPSGGATAPAAATTPAASPAPAVPSLPGEVRKRPAWHAASDSRYKTTLANCGKCHDDAEAWWYDDKHQATAERLNNRLPRAVEIATLYGLSQTEMVRGDRMCMSCHGTAPSASTGAAVLTGVSCERCHGPSSAYLEPHEDGGNPQLGMTALKQPDVQAATCLGCHRISDERLLAAGHPDGADYDIVAATGKINHWPDRRPDRERKKRNETYAGPSAGALKGAADREVAGRAIPRVTVASLPARAPAARAPAAAGGAPTAGGGAPRTAPAGAAGAATGGGAVARNRAAPPRRPQDVSRPGEGPARSTPPVPPAVRAPTTTASQTIELEPIPVRADTLTSEQLLLLVKRRLDRLFLLLGRGS